MTAIGCYKTKKSSSNRKEWVNRNLKLNKRLKDKFKKISQKIEQKDRTKR